MLFKTFSAAVFGIDAYLVEVEVDIGPGFQGRFSVVGLPDIAVKESRERIKSALRNCGFDFPFSQIVTGNLAPVDKVGSLGTLYFASTEYAKGHSADGCPENLNDLSSRADKPELPNDPEWVIASVLARGVFRCRAPKPRHHRSAVKSCAKPSRTAAKAASPSVSNFARHRAYRRKARAARLRHDWRSSTN
jgi:hypothetical protein